MGSGSNGQIGVVPINTHTYSSIYHAKPAYTLPLIMVPTGNNRVANLARPVSVIFSFKLTGYGFFASIAADSWAFPSAGGQAAEALEFPSTLAVCQLVW